MPDVPFKPSRVPRSATARSLIATVTSDLKANEQRRRARREADRERFSMAVSAIISDIAYRYLNEDGAVAVTRSRQVLTRRSRYRPAFYGETFPVLLDQLAGRGWIAHELGFNGFGGVDGRRTTIQAAERLQAEIDRLDICAEDFGIGPSPEVIILKRAASDYWDEAEPIDYTDTPETAAMRAELDAINEHLAAADITVLSDPEEEVDPLQRQLRRIFTRGSFDQGGRLFGGFWMPLSSAARLERIRIGGEPVVELDYGQLAPRVLYGMAGVRPPAGDLYAIPGLEAYRAGVKTLFNAMLFREGPMVRKPQGTAEELPAGLPVTELVRMVLATHPAIAVRFFKGGGHRVQRVESDVLVGVLTRLGGEGVVALPVHDAIVLPASKAAVGITAMKEVFSNVTGVEAVVEKVG